MKIISEIVYTIELDTETNVSRVVKQRFLTKADIKIDDSSSEPTIIRDKTKLTFNQAAMDLLDLKADDLIAIMYRSENGNNIPLIGKATAFNMTTGNKITKKGTVSFRGDMNKTLENYGSTFSLVESKDSGIFFLKGDLEVTAIPDEIIDITKELDFANMQDDNDSLDDTDLKFDFSL